MYMPGSPEPLLWQGLLEQMDAEIKFNKTGAKGRVVRGNHRYMYKLGEELLESSPAEEVLWI